MWYNRCFLRASINTKKRKPCLYEWLYRHRSVIKGITIKSSFYLSRWLTLACLRKSALKHTIVTACMQKGPFRKREKKNFLATYGIYLKEADKAYSSYRMGPLPKNLKVNKKRVWLYKIWIHTNICLNNQKINASPTTVFQ